jgi:tetrahydromethanopterin S-methyltransferase subunit A
MLVMHFVRFSNGAEIHIVRMLKPAESSVDKDFVHKKITESVSRDPKAYPKAPIVASHHAKHGKEPGRDGKNQEEDVVFFKKARFMLVVITVKIPAKTVHDVFVGKPGHKLHEAEGGQKNKDI